MQTGVSNCPGERFVTTVNAKKNGNKPASLILRQEHGYSKLTDNPQTSQQPIDLTSFSAQIVTPKKSHLYLRFIPFALEWEEDRELKREGHRCRLRALQVLGLPWGCIEQSRSKQKKAGHSLVISGPSSRTWSVVLPHP